MYDRSVFFELTALNMRSVHASVSISVTSQRHPSSTGHCDSKYVWAVP